MLRPTVSRPICFGVKHPFRDYEQIFTAVTQLRVCWRGSAISDGRTGLLFTKSKSKSKLCYDRRFSRPVRLEIKNPSGA
jgi:hypothetical protein